MLRARLRRHRLAVVFYEGLPLDTFYVCDAHREILSPDDDVVRVLTPGTLVPVERELAVYACDDDCPECWD